MGCINRSGQQEGQVEGHAGDQEGQAGGQVEGQAALSAKEIAMLQACLGDAVPAEVLSAAAGHSSRTGHFKRWLNRLLRGGLLEMTVPDKPRSPAQKYRLTDKGRAALAPEWQWTSRKPDRGTSLRAMAEGQAGDQEGQAGGQVEGQAALSAKEIAMLQACLGDAVPAEVLSAAAGHSSRTGHFKRWLNRLLRGGLLEMTVPDKPRSPDAEIPAHGEGADRPPMCRRGS